MSNLPSFSIFTLFRRSEHRRGCFGGPARVQPLAEPGHGDAIEMRVLRAKTAGKGGDAPPQHRRSTFYVDFDAEEGGAAEAQPRAVHRAFNSESDVTSASAAAAALIAARATCGEEELRVTHVAGGARHSLTGEAARLKAKRCERCRERRRGQRAAATADSTQPIPIPAPKKDDEDAYGTPTMTTVSPVRRDKCGRRGTAIACQRESGFFSSTESAASSPPSGRTPSSVPSFAPSLAPSQAPSLALSFGASTADTEAPDVYQKLSDASNSSLAAPPRSLSSSLRNILHFHCQPHDAAGASPRRRTSTVSSMVSASSAALTTARRGRRASDAALVYGSRAQSASVPASPAAMSPTAYARILHERCRSRKPSLFSATSAAAAESAAPLALNGDAAASPFENYLHNTNTSELHAQGSTQAYLLSLLSPPTSRIVVHQSRSNAAFVYGAVGGTLAL